MFSRLVLLTLSMWAAASVAFGQKWPEAKAPVIGEADGYVAIPGAALSPNRSSTYSAVFDATKMSASSDGIVPALNAAGGLLNDLQVGAKPRRNVHFVVVFHGAATDGILNNEHYRAKYGRDNPNLPVLAKMRKMGVELYVCGQHLAASHIDPGTLTKDVKIAADAYLVLIGFQNRGYGVMFF